MFVRGWLCETTWLGSRICSNQNLKPTLYYESIVLWLGDVVAGKSDAYCDIINCIVYRLSVTTGKHQKQGLFKVVYA